MKRTLYILFLVCAGVVVGSLVAFLTRNVGFLSFLSYGMDFGLTTPFVLDLSVLKLTFGLSLNLNISVLIFVTLTVLIGLSVYRKR